jgi:hypothetical protein
VQLYGPGTLMLNGQVSQESGVAVQRVGLNPESYGVIRELCADLHVRLTAAIDTEYLALYPNGYSGPPLILWS